MKKFLFGLLGISVINTAILGVTAASTWANESKLKKGYYTMDALGCMIVQECTENVRQIKNIDDIRKEFPSSDFDIIADEFNSMLVSLDKVGVMVFLADESISHLDIVVSTIL